MQYVLDQDEEITSLSCSKDSKVFFNSLNEYMVADPQIGIINIETKEVLHEYHLERNWSEHLNSVDMTFGQRMVQTPEGNFMVLPN